MKLAGFHIHRFGAQADLNLSGVADGLNVVHGPNGSGKTTVIQFIHWMLYGVRDDTSQRYLTNGQTPSRGTIEVRDPRGTHILERTNAHEPPGYLTILGTTTTAATPTNLPSDEFRRCFTICFDQPRDLTDLLRSSVIQGLEPKYDQRRGDRTQQLTSQIAGYRAELSRIDHVAVSADELYGRRQAKLAEIDSLRAEHDRRCEELAERRSQVAAEISAQQGRVNRLTNVLACIDTAIENRTNDLSAEYQRWVAERNEALARRNRRAGEMDGQVRRWQAVLEEVRQRLEQVRSRIASIGDLPVAPADAVDTHAFLRAIGVRMRDIEHDLAGIYADELWRDHEADANYLRGLLGSAMNSMQAEVAWLCQSAQHQQQSLELHECRHELSCLRRTEQELSDLVDALNRQRQQLQHDSEFWLSRFHADARDQFRTNSHSASSDELRVKARLPAELANAMNDVRLRHLIDRRHTAAAPLHDAELELANRERELRDLEQAIDGLGIDGRIAVLQRDVADIDRQLGQLEERHAIERMIAALEDEVRRLREHWGPSQIIDEASAILRRLTGNECTALRLSTGDRCQVADGRGRTLDYPLLSRGLQDQVYLSLNLALVGAFRRRGIEAPLLLNDVFANLDESGVHELIEVLADLPRQGQQVLVFTRHEHIRQRLAAKAARIFTLAGRFERISNPAPAVAPTDFAPQRIAPTADISPGSPDPTYRWVAEWQRDPESHPLIPTTPAPRPEPKHAELPEPSEQPRKRDDDSSANFEVSLASPLTKVPTVDADLIGFLQKIRIDNVQELLELDPDEAETLLGKHGITAEIIRRRQREVLLLVYLGVTPLEAQLLVACGVPDPERLGRADEAVLLKRIETILGQPQARKRFGTVADYSLARVRNWIDTARRSRYPARSRQPAMGRAGTSRRAAPVPTGVSDTVRLQSTSAMKFYLDESDPVVDAPSIGPKTAEKLNEIEVLTVRDLLALEAATIAERLDDRRINDELVRQWQLQAQLVCCIPNLRGHDAQILVACGIEDPVTLASLDASTFLDKVTEFVDSKDGQRMIRNSKKPDLAEVTAWIEWADLARQLKAA